MKELVSLAAAAILLTAGYFSHPSNAPTAAPLPPIHFRRSGKALHPKPVTSPPGQLCDVLGVRVVSYPKGTQALAVKDQKLI